MIVFYYNFETNSAENIFIKCINYKFTVNIQFKQISYWS